MPYWRREGGSVGRGETYRHVEKNGGNGDDCNDSGKNDIGRDCSVFIDERTFDEHEKDDLNGRT